YVDFAVLRGDPSDGLPGVAGIGEKTAASLLSRHHDLAGILAAAQREKSPLSAGVRGKLTGAVDHLGPASEVVAVARDVTLPLDIDDLELVRAPVEPERWAALVAELGLGGSAERVTAALTGDRG